MSIKRLIIIFLIIILAPVVLGKVDMPPFSDFYRSWDSFKLSFKKLVSEDYQYYKNLIMPWINRGIDFSKEKLKQIIDNKLGEGI